MTSPPPRPAAPVRRTPGQTTAPSAPPKSFTVRETRPKEGNRIVLYGTGGIGKTSLAALAPKPLFICLDPGGVRNINAPDIAGVQSWADLMAALQTESLWQGYRTVVIDSGTAAQELAVAHTLANVPHEKGNKVNSVEGYGFGKGFRFVYDTFLPLLVALEQHAKRGRDVILICHDSATKAPNPEGDDYLRYEPLLMNSNNGNIRERVKSWADHILFLQYDKSVKDGKAIGYGTRTVYVQETPWAWAKSRTLRDPVLFEEGDRALWLQLLGENAYQENK